MRLFVGALPLVAIALWAAYLWSARYMPADVSTYLAAGERLNAGHSLYGPLGPGDRVVLDWQQYGAPLVSPPLVAVIWRPLAALGPWTMYPWWGLTIAALLGVYLAAWVRAPLLTGLLAIPAAFQFSVELGLANLDALILAGTVITWLLWQRGRPGFAMALAVLLAALKVYPVVLVVWLFVVAPRATWRPFLGAVGILLAVSVAGAGVGAHLDYLRVLAVTGASASRLRLVLAGCCTVGVVLLRRWPAASYAAAVLAIAVGYSPPALLALGFVAVAAPVRPAHRVGG